MKKEIEKRIAELKKENKTYILFHEKYLLEGETVGLARSGNSMGYVGERILNYSTIPPAVFNIQNNCVICSDLEKLFEEDVNGN